MATIGCSFNILVALPMEISQKKKKKNTNVTQSRTGLQIYEGRDDQLNRTGPMA
jgi:hypothetical protein